MAALALTATRPFCGERIGLVAKSWSWYSTTMTTVAEIEHAIEALPAPEVSEVAEWIVEHQMMLSAASDVFSMLDAEEGEGEQWCDSAPIAERSGS